MYERTFQEFRESRQLRYMDEMARLGVEAIEYDVEPWCFHVYDDSVYIEEYEDHGNVTYYCVIGNEEKISNHRAVVEYFLYNQYLNW